MARKNIDAPRKIYVRKGFAHILFEGKHYGARDTDIDASDTVTVTRVSSNGGRARIQVAVVGDNEYNVVETWESLPASWHAGR